MLHRSFWIIQWMMIYPVDSAILLMSHYWPLMSTTYCVNLHEPIIKWIVPVDCAIYLWSSEASLSTSSSLFCQHIQFTNLVLIIIIIITVFCCKETYMSRPSFLRYPEKNNIINCTCCKTSKHNLLNCLNFLKKWLSKLGNWMCTKWP